MKGRITGTTRLMGLIGRPVGHSGSPAMYNYCFEKMGLDYAYLAFDIGAEQVGEFMQAARLLKMKAVNVTMPCKQAVVPYMDELSQSARLIGACNLLVQEEGRWTGYNTDGIGFVKNLREHGAEVTGQRVVIAGAGGAGTAILVQCALEGAKEILVFNRKSPNYTKGEEKIRLLQKEAPQCRLEMHDLEDEEGFYEAVSRCDLFINASRVGMAPEAEDSVIGRKEVFRPELTVADVVYNPMETRLLREAKEAGCRKVIGGIGMLLWQGAENYRIFTGEEMPVEEVEAAGLAGRR